MDAREAANARAETHNRGISPDESEATEETTDAVTETTEEVNKENTEATTETVETETPELEAEASTEAVTETTEAETSTEKEEGTADKLIDLLIEVRARAREKKDWALADLIRESLSELNIKLEDRPEGTIARLEEKF